MLPGKKLTDQSDGNFSYPLHTIAALQRNKPRCWRGKLLYRRLCGARARCHWEKTEQHFQIANIRLYAYWKPISSRISDIDLELHSQRARSLADALRAIEIFSILSTGGYIQGALHCKAIADAPVRLQGKRSQRFMIQSIKTYI